MKHCPIHRTNPIKQGIGFYCRQCWQPLDAWAQRIEACDTDEQAEAVYAEYVAVNRIRSNHSSTQNT